MITVSIFMLYALMIAIFDTEVGILFGTIFLVSMIAVMKLIELTRLDKKINKWLGE